MSGSKIRLYGSTSGYVELAPPAVSPDAVLTLPSTFAGVGSNVVQTVKTDTFVTASTSYVTVTGLTATLTPTSASSKVLIIAQVAHALGVGSGYGHFQLAGGNTSGYIGDASSSRIRNVFGGGTNANADNTLILSTIVYLDSPATTSATTYEVQARQAGGASAFVNRSNTDADNAFTGRGVSSITLIEVAA